MDARTLSRTEARVILSLESEGKEELTLGDIEVRASISRPHARKVAHGLVRKGWIQRTTRASYLLNPARHGPDAIPDTDPFRLGSHLLDPYYFGYASAAELLGLLPQAGRIYYLASPRHRSSSILRAAEFRIVHSSGERFFGLETLSRGRVRVSASDLERTVLDCMDRPEYSGGIGGAVHILSAAKPKIRWSVLASYLGRFRNRSLALRVGYLAEHVRPEIAPPERFLRRFRPKDEEGYVPLGPARSFGRRGHRDPRWHVIENVPPGQLYAEVDVR
jgi:predicted transcriptional regulator of viral defense system